jgi:hypothetical protein
MKRTQTNCKIKHAGRRSDNHNRAMVHIAFQRSLDSPRKAVAALNGSETARSAGPALETDRERPGRTAPDRRPSEQKHDTASTSFIASTSNKRGKGNPNADPGNASNGADIDELQFLAGTRRYKRTARKSSRNSEEELGLLSQKQVAFAKQTPKQANQWVPRQRKTRRRLTRSSSRANLC